MGFLKSVPFSLKGILFSYHWIIRRVIGDGVRTVLDIGCGDGAFMSAISDGEGWQITGVELYERSVKKAKESGIYKEVIKADVTKLPKSVRNKKYDLVFASQILEHLSKIVGTKCLKNWEKLARERIVLSTPVGFIEYDPIESKAEDNPLQVHLSGWQPKELKKKGYTIRGQGLRVIYGENGLARKFPNLLPIFQIIAYMFSPIVYFLPKLATYMIARKEK